MSAMKDFPTPELPSNIKTARGLSLLVRNRDRYSMMVSIIAAPVGNLQFTFNLPDGLSLTDDLSSKLLFELLQVPDHRVVEVTGVFGVGRHQDSETPYQQGGGDHSGAE